ncbi:MAG TPA: amidase [Planctomycetaceae bacterium]
MAPSGTRVSVEESGAFVDQISIAPTAPGPLSSLTFAVKDLIDIAGRTTGCGNPSWGKTHAAAACHALCVDQLLAAGAHCVGKTVTDELAFSLIGENHFYGTPLNPRAPGRVPGGSSSGSASAVACGLVDFALGTDTGGSVRVPSANCGLFGLRPSHGVISVAGVMPFAPGFDTVGVMARDAEILARIAETLLGVEIPPAPRVVRVHLVTEALALCEPDARGALNAPLAALRDVFGDRLQETSIHEIDGESPAAGLEVWYESVYRILQWAEIWSSLGSWINEAKPEFGPVTAGNFELARTLNRADVGPAVRRRETYCVRLSEFLEPGVLLCIPTTPAPPPLKGTIGNRSQDSSNYYPAALSLTSLAGVGRLPQVSLPLGECNGGPLGLSLLAGHGGDAFLLGAVRQLVRELPTTSPQRDRS